MSLTFQEVASLWKADKRQWIKPSSYATYVRLVHVHLLPYFADCQSFSEAFIQQYVYDRLQDGLRVKTIRDSMIVFKMILRYGEKLGAWPHVPFEVHYPSSAMEGPRQVSVMDWKDQQRLAGYLQTHFSFRNLGILICMHSGLRIGELCALQWKDLDVDAGVILVTKTVQRLWLSDGEEHQNVLQVGPPKTLSSVREIPISHELMRVIRPLRKVMDARCYVLSNADDPLEPRYFRDYFKKLLSSLDIKPVRFHALRHSFATRCIESKCDYKTVSAILGHASISTTLDLYVHPGLQEKKRCIEKLSKALR